MLAVIDIGTNSTKLLVGTTGARGIQTVMFRRGLTRIGAGIERTGRMSRERIGVTADVVARFADLARARDCRHIAAFGTFAFRRAANGRRAAAAISRAAGIPVRILSGREEARLAYVSARAGIDRPRPGAVIVDVGGGSTEFIVVRGGQLVTARSLRLGALHLTERYLHSDPIDATEMSALMREVRATVDRALARVDLAPAGFDFVLSGGTATTGTRMLGPGHDSLSYAQSRRLLELCISRTLAARRRLRGLPADRADIMPAGLVILNAFFRATGKRVARVNAGGVREGYLLDWLDRQAP